MEVKDLCSMPNEVEVQKWLPWCRSLPKVELHAHLNGSIRSSTLIELAADLSRRGITVFKDFEAVIMKEDRSLSECFKLFDLIHALTTDHDTITRITKEVVEDFAAENVIYLELRTTPKCNAAVGMSKRSYVEAVLSGFKAVDAVEAVTTSYATARFCNDHPGNTDSPLEETRKKPKIYVRLILSIDRRETTEAAMETVQLAAEMRRFGVVGVDLSGNPRIGDWQTFVPALTWARKQGIPITIHCGEVPNSLEVRGILAFQPDRVGHICCLEEPEWATVLRSTIPVEICLTSNVRTETIPSICDHHFAILYKAKHPLIICTDDPGVFATDISHEYALAAVCFDLPKSDLLRLAEEAIQYIFAEDDLKEILQGIFDAAKQNQG